MFSSGVLKQFSVLVLGTESASSISTSSSPTEVRTPREPSAPETLEDPMFGLLDCLEPWVRV